MSYTQTDLDSIDQALLALALGTRKSSITIDGDRVDLSEVTLEQLQRLRGIVETQISGTAFVPRSIVKNGGRA